MNRIDVNRSGEMEVFARIVELGGFSAAARHLDMSPSAVSKLAARLEARLGVRLINRSTRKLQLTPEGQGFYDRSVRALEELDAAEREAAAGAAPRGRLRVNAFIPFGVHCLLPIIPAFLARHPEIIVDIALTDRVVDLMEERADIAIRTGTLRESRLTARKLGESRLMVVAAPSYLERFGEPRAPDDLFRHNLLDFCFKRYIEGWPFRDRAGAPISIPVRGNALVSDGEAMRLLALSGLGLARLSSFHVAADIAAGRLRPVLEDFSARDVETIHAVFLGPGGSLPARARAFLDFLAANIHLG